MIIPTQLGQFLTTFAATQAECDATKGATFFGLPAWYKYLELEPDPIGRCVPVVSVVSDYWLIGLAIVDLLIRLAGMIAVGFVIYAGIQYMVSNGSPDRAKAAKEILLNAAIGLVVVVLAASVVSFIGGRLTQ